MEHPTDFPKHWQLRTCRIDLNEPKVMGILNVTPDSFSDGGQYAHETSALERAQEIFLEGGHLLDVGGESTRPGAKPVGIEEEWRRIGPVLKGLNGNYELPISVDTRHGEVAKRALDEGVEVINDVSAGSDPILLKAVAESGAGLILMHMRREPENMMEAAHYQKVGEEVRQELSYSLQRALDAGVAPEKICLDPGFGFSKTPQQNYRLLDDIGLLAQQGYPLLVGLSKKRLLREIVGPGEEELKTASKVAALVAYTRGAQIFRVHDVLETVVAFKTLQELTRGLKII